MIVLPTMNTYIPLYTTTLYTKAPFYTICLTCASKFEAPSVRDPGFTTEKY